MKTISKRFSAQQWCNSSTVDNGSHSLLITDVASRDFYGGQFLPHFGGHEMNTFTVGYNTDDSMPRFNDELFLKFFENALLDYTYHTIFFDLPNRDDDADAYRVGIEKMLDLIMKYQPNSYLVYVDSTKASPVGRELCEERGGRYIDVIGKTKADLEAIALDISKLPLRERNICNKALSLDELKERRETMYWCVNDMDDYAEDDQRKRVLLVGDSICFGYYHKTREMLNDEFIVDTYAMSFAPGDPAIIRNMLPLLHAYKYDAIHINVCMHTAAYDHEKENYEAAMREILSFLRNECPDTKLCYATSATISRADDLSKLSDVTFGWVKDRNDAAIRVCKELSIPIDDLFKLCIEKNPEKFDVFHYKDYTLLAEQVAKSIKELF